MKKLFSIILFVSINSSICCDRYYEFWKKVDCSPEERHGQMAIQNKQVEDTPKNIQRLEKIIDSINKSETVIQQRKAITDRIKKGEHISKDELLLLQKFASVEVVFLDLIEDLPEVIKKTAKEHFLQNDTLVHYNPVTIEGAIKLAQKYRAYQSKETRVSEYQTGGSLSWD